MKKLNHELINSVTGKLCDSINLCFFDGEFEKILSTGNLELLETYDEVPFKGFSALFEKENIGKELDEVLSGTDDDKLKGKKVIFPGWVFASFDNGKPTFTGADSFENKNLLVFDMENENPDFDKIHEILEGSGLSYVLHTLANHKAEDQKLRAYIPLSIPEDNPVAVQAVSRKMMETLGLLEYQSKSTHDPIRLLDLPVIPSDGEYRVEMKTDGLAADPEAVLNLYRDNSWILMDNWPVATWEEKLTGPAEETHSVPCPYTGWEKAVVEAYPIAELMTHGFGLVDPQYVHVNGSEYKRKHTDSAAYVFDGWRLVCLDSDFDPNFKYKWTDSLEYLCKWKFDGDMEAMRKWAFTNQAVRSILAGMLIDEAPEEDPEFTDDGELVFPQHFINKKTKGLRCTPYIVYYICKYDPRLGGLPRDNRTTGLKELQGRLPWDRDDDEDIQDVFTKKDYTLAKIWFSKHYDINPGKFVEDAIDSLAFERGYDPWKEKLESYRGTWDHAKRIDTFMKDQYGVENPLAARGFRLLLINIIRRCLHHGCYYPYCLTFTGPEGNGKSFFTACLAFMDQRFYTSSFRKFGEDEEMRKLAKVVLAELAEFTAVKKSEADELKEGITTTNDKYREKYEKDPSDHKRVAIFIGSTNSRSRFLKDEGENRRFLILEAVPDRRKITPWDKEDPESMINIIGQLYAEAWETYTPEQWEKNWDDSWFWDFTDEEKAILVKQNEKYKMADDNSSAIREYCSSMIPAKIYDINKRDYIFPQNDAILMRKDIIAAYTVTSSHYEELSDSDRKQLIKDGYILRPFVCVQELKDFVFEKDPKVTPTQIMSILEKNSDFVRYEGNKELDKLYGKKIYFRSSKFKSDDELEEYLKKVGVLKRRGRPRKY